MCEYLGYEVTKLSRSRIMNVELGQLLPGQWRDLTASEMAEINAAVAGSRKTAMDDDFAETLAETTAEISEAPKKIDIAADIKHASSTIESGADKYVKRQLTRIDVKKPAATSTGKKRLSLKKKS
jgi:23S rRNA pseudouridine2604 synthase/16S rRNA pseudouridine516 synthase